MTCPDDVADWPPAGVLFDNADGEYPPHDERRILWRRGRWRPIDDGPSIDTYQPEPERTTT